MTVTPAAPSPVILAAPSPVILAAPSPVIPAKAGIHDAASAPRPNPEAVFLITYDSLRGWPFRACGWQLLERRDPQGAAPRIGGVARVPLPALWGAHPARGQRSPRLLSAAA